VIKIEPANEFYDYEAKYLSTKRAICAQRTECSARVGMQRLAKRSFALIGGQGWGRVDFLMDKEGKPYLLEVNTSPGMMITVWYQWLRAIRV